MVEGGVPNDSVHDTPTPEKRLQVLAETDAVDEFIMQSSIEFLVRD